MRTVTLPDTDLGCSRFIFGTASLFNVGARGKRLDLLASALDSGFTHFDTAPYYGFGWAERDLGELLRQHPNATVTTKVGLYSAGGENQSQAAVLLRKAAGRLAPALSRPEVDFALKRARASLEASLLRLRRSKIDLYLLHEPAAGLLAVDEWQRWLEDETRAGRVGTFGVALVAAKLPALLAQAPDLLRVIQVNDSLHGEEANAVLQAGRQLQITFGYVSASRATGSSQSVAEVLRGALRRNAAGAIIVSTTRRERLRQYAKLLDSGA